MRRLLLCIALAASGASAAQDLHLQPVGTRVTKQFNLGPAVFYLPESDWVLAATHARTGTLQRSLEGPKFAGVVLFDVRDGQVARAVLVYTSIEPVLGNRGWLPSEDPCKRRDDVYLHRELGQNYQNQYCVQINHRVPFLVESKGWSRDALGWLTENKVKLPRTALAVEFARIDRAFQTQLYYFFNPDIEGIAPAAAGEWKSSEWHRDRVGRDPARAAYLESLARWSDAAAPAVRAGFFGEPAKAAFPQPPFPAK